ncbi:MAG: maleylpyruvate isomerase family mycothiol-dependent enzyme [Nocardioides sp.]
MSEVWPLVHVERRALIEDLAGLADERWAVDSLCAGWTVHDVVAHLIDNAMTTRLKFVRDMMRAGFDFDRQNARGIRRERGTSPADALQRLRQVADRTAAPPGALDSRLVEEVVHGEDVRRPLGITRTYPSAAVVRSLHYQARTPVAFGGAKQRVATVRLMATDTDLTLGKGPVVEGPALSLLLAISGRVAVINDLSGPGLGALR